MPPATLIKRGGFVMLNHRLKKHALPWATRLFASPPLRQFPSLLEKTGAALQSKRGGGYASIWQEVEGALNFIASPRPVIFDVGANVGNWTSSLLKALPDTRRVFMFEPQPSCWVSLDKLCDERTSLEKRAASNTTEKLTFWANSNSEISSLYEEAGGGAESHPILVESIAIDDFVSANGIDSVDYVKIDVEGHELSVIKGASHSIANGTVKALSFEFGQADVASHVFPRLLGMPYRSKPTDLSPWTRRVRDPYF
jgi:FkbM family methyltransferase